MIKIANVEVFGWEAAIRGMRNPMNSWGKSDSKYHLFEVAGNFITEIGENDLKLMKSLSKAGTDHSKFLRMINVTVDIVAPLYWWKEFDTYKVGTVANSCSTMHKIHDKKFTLDDFSCEHLTEFSETNSLGDIIIYDCKQWLRTTIAQLNWMRDNYIKTKDKHYWWQMIQLLPTSYNQRRTVQLNYQVLKSIYEARWNHKLDEWVYFCEWMHDLPYFKEICLNEED